MVVLADRAADARSLEANLTGFAEEPVEARRIMTADALDYADRPDAVPTPHTRAARYRSATEALPILGRCLLSRERVPH